MDSPVLSHMVQWDRTDSGIYKTLGWYTWDSNGQSNISYTVQWDRTDSGI